MASKQNNIMARESVWGSIVTYIGVALGFFTTFFVLATYLSPEEVGLTRVLVELSTLLSGFAMLGLSTSISRYFPYFAEVEEVAMSEGETKRSPAHRGFFFWLMCISGVGLLFTLSLYAFGADLINPFFGSGSALLREYYVWVLPLTTFITLWTVAELYAIQLMRLAIPRVIKELVLRLLLLISYAAYALGWVSLVGFVALFVAAYALCMLLAYLYLSRITTLSLAREEGFPDKELQRGFARYSLLATLSVVGTTLAGRMDLFVLTFIPSAGLRSVAVFTIGFFMVSIIEIPTRAIIGLATARIAQMMRSEDYSRVAGFARTVSHYQLLTSLVLYLIVYASLTELIGLMPSAKAYQGSAEVFVILGLSKLIEVSFTASHPIINTSRFYQWSLYYTLWCVVAAFLANVYFIPLWDVRGAAAATLLTTILGYALLQCVIKYRLGFTLVSGRMLRSLLLGLVLYLIIPYLPSVEHQLLSILLRSLCVGALSVLGIVALRLAPEAESYLLGYLRKCM